MPDLILSEEEQMLQTMVRDFADRELIPRAREADERQEFSWENWKGMADLGLTGGGISGDVVVSVADRNRNFRPGRLWGGGGAVALRKRAS